MLRGDFDGESSQGAKKEKEVKIIHLWGRINPTQALTNGLKEGIDRKMAGHRCPHQLGREEETRSVPSPETSFQICVRLHIKSERGEKVRILMPEYAEEGDVGCASKNPGKKENATGEQFYGTARAEPLSIGGTEKSEPATTSARK